jgi:hypothetical protein
LTVEITAAPERLTQTMATVDFARFASILK